MIPSIFRIVRVLLYDDTQENKSWRQSVGVLIRFLSYAWYSIEASCELNKSSAI